MWLWANTTGDFDIVFYDSDGVTATTLATIDKDVSIAAAGLMRVKFTTTKTLNPGTNYRIAVVPTSATTLTIYDADCNAAADLDAISGGQEFHLTTVNGAPAADGDWTNATSNRPFMGIWLDQMSDDAGTGGGGGGSTYPRSRVVNA
jgi:hypothetical protein